MILLQLPDAHTERRRWLTSEPFPHVTVEHAIYPDEAAAIGNEYPPPTDSRWHTFTGEREAGKQEGRASIAGPNVAAIHETLAGDEFVGWLRVVSGIPDLIADPTRHGGGIHQSGPGARLALHTDFNLLPTRPELIRAVNVILFVGPHPWPTLDGVLQLGANGEACVIPDPGTLAAFEASDMSWHGHPYPMAPNAPLRKSVPCYFYRPLAEGEVVEQHSTRFLADNVVS